MPFYAWIHPLFQIVILVIGLYNASLWMGKAQTWTFPLSRYRRISWIFTVFLIIGSVLGRICNSMLHKNKIDLRIPGHNTMGTIILIAVIVGLVFMELGLRNPKKNREVLKWHIWFFILALGLYFAQGFLGLMALLGL